MGLQFCFFHPPISRVMVQNQMLLKEWWKKTIKILVKVKTKIQHPILLESLQLFPNLLSPPILPLPPNLYQAVASTADKSEQNLFYLRVCTKSKPLNASPKSRCPTDWIAAWKRMFLQFIQHLAWKNVPYCKMDSSCQPIVCALLIFSASHWLLAP